MRAKYKYVNSIKIYASGNSIMSVDPLALDTLKHQTFDDSTYYKLPIGKLAMNIIPYRNIHICMLR